MPTVRVQPPGVGSTTSVVNGRTYVGVAGTPQDVPDFDAAALESNNWIRTPGTSGTTAQRPTPTVNKTVGTNPAALTYWDTTISKQIHWDGKTWRDSTGAAV